MNSLKLIYLSLLFYLFASFFAYSLSVYNFFLIFFLSFISFAWHFILIKKLDNLINIFLTVCISLYIISIPYLFFASDEWWLQDSKSLDLSYSFLFLLTIKFLLSLSILWIIFRIPRFFFSNRT